VQRVSLAQQSMSLGEERVYQALWHAKPVEGVTPLNRRVKTFSMGYDRLARLTRLNEKSIRDLLPKLIDKKILDIVKREDSWTRTGRTYHIYSYEEILDRQRAADLCYVVKNGRAVEFVRSPLTTPATEGVSPTVGESSSVPGSHTDTVGFPGAISVGHTPTPLDNLRQTSQKPSSSPDLDVLSRSIRTVLQTFDDDAVKLLWSRCRETDPQCTTDDVFYCFELKAKQLLNGRKQIDNPVGLMIFSVPRSLQGPDAIHLIRRREIEAARVAEAEWSNEYEQKCEEWRALLRNPATPENERGLLRKLLGERG
jgi:hypothetical protein